MPISDHASLLIRRAEAVAEKRGVSIGQVSRVLFKNTRRLDEIAAGSECFPSTLAKAFQRLAVYEAKPLRNRRGASNGKQNGGQEKAAGR